MLRLALFPFVTLILFLLSAIIIWVIYKKVKKGIGYTLKKGAKIANDQQQKRAEKEKQKRFPEILQKGFSDYDKIYNMTSYLPTEWELPIMPLVSSAKNILDELALEFEGKSEDSQNKANNENKKLNSIRGFFIHSLDALLQFVEKLSSDHHKMTADEIEKAHQNINVFKSDLLHHQETLHKVRRFDFDVVMDVIKARLK